MSIRTDTTSRGIGGILQAPFDLSLAARARHGRYRLHRDVDCLAKLGNRRDTLDLETIDEEGWCRRYPLLPALGHFGVDGIGVATTIETSVELLGVEPKVSRESLEIVLAVRPTILSPLLLEELVVIGPELALIVGALGRLSRPERLRTEKRVVAPDQLGASGSNI